MLLFNPKPRTDPAPRRGSETTFEFLDRVSTPFWEHVRTLLNDWFSHLPLSEQQDVAGRFRGKTQRQTLAAFWELYLRELFARLGFTVVLHPSVLNSSSRVDFQIIGLGHDFYLEAVTVADQQQDEQLQQLDAAVQDAINKIPSGDFFVLVEHLREGDTQPPFRTLISGLTRWLHTLNPDHVTADYEASSRDFVALPKWVWTHGNWELEFTAIPKKPETRGQEGGITYGAGPVRGGIVDDHRAIEANLRGKVRKYGALHKPYVIGLLSLRATTGLLEVLLGMFGCAYEQPGFIVKGVGDQESWPNRITKSSQGGAATQRTVAPPSACGS